MQRTGGMRRARWMVAVVAAWAGCGGDDGGAKDGSITDDDGSIIDSPIDSPFDPPIDAPRIDAAVPIDAATDASGCGTDLRLVGNYFDWDSTLQNPIAIGGAEWSVVGDLARTTLSRPNGDVVLCISPAQPSQITVSSNGYLPALFLADPAVFSPLGSRFLARNVQAAGPTGAAAQFAEFGVAYNSAFAHVVVYNLGVTPIPLALGPVVNPPQRNFVNGGGLNDITWTDGNSGKATLFPNRPFGNGMATLTSTSMFTGPTNIPIASGRVTIVVIRSP